MTVKHDVKHKIEIDTAKLIVMILKSVELYSDKK